MCNIYDMEELKKRIYVIIWTVAQWLPHSMKVLGLNPGSRVCTSASSHSPKTWLFGKSRMSEHDCLSLYVGPVTSLATCGPRLSTNVSRDWPAAFLLHSFGDGQVNMPLISQRLLF